MNAIFLDVDGVLNDGVNTEKINETNIKKLAKVCEEFDADVVLFSDYKYNFDKNLTPKNEKAEKFINLIKKYNINLRKTPNLAKNKDARLGKLNLIHPTEIISYIVQNKTLKYVIMDSKKIRDKVLFQNFVFCEGGLTDDDINSAKSIFSRKK